MKSKELKLLDDSEATAIMVGSTIGIGILSIPNAVVKDAKQYGWIAVFFGSLYPLIIVLSGIYLCKKHPNENILVLNRIYFGKLIGTVFNVLFSIRFFIYVSGVMSGFTNALRVYIVPFLTPEKIIIVTLLLIIYLNIKGLKTIATVNKIALYFTIILSLFLLPTLITGNYLNLMPLKGIDFKGIVTASKKLIYYYGGMEIFLLIYPRFKHKENIVSISIKALLIVLFTYLWIVIITTYYLGYRLIDGTIWPVLLLVENIEVPFLNVSRYIYLLFWSTVVFKTAANEYYGCILVSSDLFKINRPFLFYIVSFIPFLYFSSKLSTVYRSALLSRYIPMITLFEILPIGLLVLFIFVKSRRNL